MIKPHELRLGNWVNSNIKGCTRIKEGNVQLFEEQLYYLFDVDDDWQRITAIPLTESWLINNGFIKQLDGNYKHPNSHEIEVFFHNRGFEVMVDSTCKNHIKHIHNFQNLFFALTGSEL